MSWPALQKSVKTIDMSIYQNRMRNTSDPASGRTDFAELANEHPEIKVVVSRAAGAWSGPDPDFPHNFEESEQAGFRAAAYVNSNPAKKVKDLLTWWRGNIGVRKPKLIVLDSEITGGQSKTVITKHVQDCQKAIHDTWPSAVVALQYTATWWWNPNINHGWEGDLLVWPAHYPYVVQDPANGKWHQAFHFEDMDSKLPIHNSFTPSIPLGFSPENVMAWQLTEKGIIEPISRAPNFTPRVDLNYLLLSFFKKVWQDGDEPSPVEPDHAIYLRTKASALRAVAADMEMKADEWDG